MTDPFLVRGPALLSFSGGRTSAFMLRKILDAHGGRLPPDVVVAFANTGKERPETLDFVRDCQEAWGVPVRWVERDPSPEARRRGSVAVREVSYETASRDGAPYAQLLAHIRALRAAKGEQNYLPNPAQRICTTELKVRVMKRVMRGLGYGHWDMVLGIRADEPRRVARLRAPTSERWEHVLPLADAGVTERDVLDFWRAQPFDLRLRPHEGNCDLCFLKRVEHRVLIMAERPDLAAWWAEQERLAGKQFLAATRTRKGEPTYAHLNAAAPGLAEGARRRLQLAPDEGGVDCVCHD
jgi:3'-phosphoadenosine 5'-phosphosulfate sulfotransferase (PAPS reductase)/FAD synthetase